MLYAGSILMHRTWWAVGLCAVAANAAWAQNSTYLGLNVNAADDGYRGVGIKTRVLPALSVQTERFSLRGTSAEYLLTDPAKTDFSINLRADAVLQGYKASDDVLFAGMAQRKHSLLVGLGSKFLTPIGQLWLEAGTDVLGASKGLRTEVGLGWRIDTSTPLGKWSLTPYVSAQHNSAKLVDYYYGVNPSEATLSRPAYAPGAATNFNLGLSAATDLGESTRLVLGARYRGYGASIRQSPLIDSASGLSGSASLLYRLP
jgi:MipA family protein